MERKVLSNVVREVVKKKKKKLMMMITIITAAAIIISKRELEGMVTIQGQHDQQRTSRENPRSLY